MPDEDRKQAKDRLPNPETELQPDPMLRTRRGSRVTLWAWIVGLVIVVVLIMVFYSLNSKTPPSNVNATSPATNQTTQTQNGEPPASVRPPPGQPVRHATQGGH